MGNDIEKAFEAAEQEIWELWGEAKGKDDTLFPSAIMQKHIGPLLAGDAMRGKYKTYRHMLDEAHIRETDLKERADIADSIHKEMMGKLERYRKALEDIAYGIADPASGHLTMKARKALAK